MNELEQSGLARMRDCWITGGTAGELAPAAWREIAGSLRPDERERTLLAIAGQAFDVALRPAAPKTLAKRAPLPSLSLPTLQERTRPLFRTAVKAAGDARARTRVAALVASRGFVAHPLDWMPSASDQDVPGVYAPWVDWQAGAGSKGNSTLAALTVESWDEFYPAARRVLLTAMRKADPTAARALLEAKAAGEPAETRLALVDLLRVGLSADDASFLEGLSGDRSGKVRQLAMRLLARVGRSEAGSDDAVAELAGFIEQDRAGFIRRRTVYRPLTLKSDAQQRRRAELFEFCQLIDLTARLGTGDMDFIAGWQFGADDGADMEMAAMVGASGSDEAAAQLADRLIAEGSARQLLPLLQRLDDQRKQGFVEVALSGDAAALSLLNAAAEIEPGGIDHTALMASRAYEETLAATAGRNEAERRTAFVNLAIFGFLATASAARDIMADVTGAGLAAADPGLALLRLNAALDEPSPHAAT